jgi:hypothetical protein
MKQFQSEEAKTRIDYCTTNQLIYRLKENSPQVFEANLKLRGLNATHYIYYKKGKIYDEGIDEKNIRWKEDEFLNHYQSNKWVIDYVDSPIING